MSNTERVSADKTVKVYFKRNDFLTGVLNFRDENMIGLLISEKDENRRNGKGIGTQQVMLPLSLITRIVETKD